MKISPQIMVFMIYFVILSHCFKFSAVKSQDQKVENATNFTDDKKCNATHFEFYGLKYFSREQQMKLAVQKINQNYSSLGSISYSPDSNDRYYISPYANYEYKNPNVTVKLLSSNMISVERGRIEAQINFNWYRYQQPGKAIRRATGKAVALTSQIPYTINVTQFYGYYVVGFRINNWATPKVNEIKLISLQNEEQDPVPITDQEIFVINYMLNKLPDESVVSSLEKTINQGLDKSVYYVDAEDFPSTIKTTTYIWNNTCNEKQIYYNNFDKIYYLLENNQNSTFPGFYLAYQSKIYDYESQICGPQLPKSFPDPSKYGTSQQFISLTFLQNLLDIGFEKKQFSTILERQNWGTKSFKFSARQMSFIFPNISENFEPLEQVSGICEPEPNSIKLLKETNTTLNVTITQKCTLNIRGTKIVQITLSLMLEIESIQIKQELNFWVNSYSFTTTYNDSFGYKMLNKVLADVNVRQTLSRLYEMKLFGSGLKLAMQRTKPQILVLDNAILVYDAKF